MTSFGICSLLKLKGFSSVQVEKLRQLSNKNERVRATHTENGFPWMLDVVAALRYDATHREQYPTLDDFYPEIARCLSKYVQKN